MARKLICVILYLLFMILFCVTAQAQNVNPIIKFNSPDVKEAILSGTLRIEITAKWGDASDSVRKTIITISNGSSADFTLAGLPLNKVILITANAVGQDGKTLAGGSVSTFVGPQSANAGNIVVNQTSTVAVNIINSHLLQKLGKTSWEIDQHTIDLVYQEIEKTGKISFSDSEMETIAQTVANALNNSAIVATPTFSLAPGRYTDAESVSLRTQTAGATIYYTTDGRTPTTDSTKYTSAITVSESQTIKAIAVKSGWANSSIASAAYVVLGKLSGSVTDKLSGKGIAFASISFVMNGKNATDKTSSIGGFSLICIEPGTYTFYVAAEGYEQISKTITIKSGINPSANFALTPSIVMPPTFNPAAGTYTKAQSVTLSTTTSGATIYYTRDGTAPTTVSTKYTGPIMVSGSETIKAIGVKSGWTSSNVTSATYIISGSFPVQFGSSSDDFANGVATDSSGNVYVVGQTSGTLAGTNAGSNDAFLAKYNSSGEIQWIKQFGSSDYDYDCGRGVKIDSSGNVYVVGETHGNLGGANAGSVDAFLAKYNSNGEIQWIKQFGSSDYDCGQDLEIDGSGNIYVTGTTNGNLGGANAGYDDAFLVKCSSSGEIQWTKQFGSSYTDSGQYLAIDGSGNIYIAGRVYGVLDETNNPSADATVVKFNSNGELQWTKQFGSSKFDLALGIATDSNGNIYVTGVTYGDFAGVNAGGIANAFLVKYNSDGETQWAKQFGSSDSSSANGVAIDSGGNIYIIGGTSGTFGGTNAGSTGGFLARYNSNAELQWAKQFGLSNLDSAVDLAVDRTGNIYVVGNTRGNLFGTNAGNDDVFLVKYNSNGEMQ